MPHISNKDLENKELNMLPIRRGCLSEKCACLGLCQNIVGEISREEYGRRIGYFDSCEEMLRDYLAEQKPKNI